MFKRRGSVLLILLFSFTVNAQILSIKYRNLENKFRYTFIDSIPILAQKISNIPLEKNILQSWSKGRNAFFYTDYFVSEDFLTEALKSAKKQKDPLLIAEIEFDLAQTFLVSDEVSIALKYLLHVKDIFLKKGTSYQKARLYIAFGELYRKLKDMNSALNSLNRAKKYAEESDEILSRCYNRIAAIWNENNDKEKCYYFSNLALQYAKKINNVELIAIAENEITSALENVYTPNECLIRYKDIENLWLSIHNLRYAMDARCSQLNIYSKNEIDDQKALVLIEKTLKVVKGKKWFNVEFIANEAAANIYLRKKKYDEAFKYLGISHAVNYDMRENRSLNKLKIAERKFNYEKSQKVIINQKLNLEKIEKDKNQLTIISIGIFIVLLLIGFIALIQVRQKSKMRIKNIILNEIIEKNKALVQEIHHRVKNNLQSISIIVEMQMNYNINKNLHSPLEDVFRRISSMKLVHEMLYQQNDLTLVSLKPYLKELILSMEEMTTIDNRKVSFCYDLEEVYIDSSKCIAIGMITSEIISNSIKYAILNDDELIITLKLIRLGDGVVFEINDNGQFNKSKNPRNDASLGFRLIEIFMTQIKAKFTLDKENGYHYRIIFNESNGKK